MNIILLERNYLRIYNKYIINMIYILTNSFDIKSFVNVWKIKIVEQYLYLLIDKQGRLHESLRDQRRGNALRRKRVLSTYT